MNDCHEYKGLLVGLLDQELTQEEAARVNTHLIRCARCREDYEQLRETSGQLESISFKEPLDLVYEKVWKSPYSRLTRHAAWILLIGGYVLLLGYGLFVFFYHGPEDVPVKVSVAAISLGFVILLIQFIRERLKTYKSDPYREIER